MSQAVTLPRERASLQAGKVTMQTLNTWATHVRSVVGTLVLALVLASVLGGISVVPAFGQEREWRAERWRERRAERAERWRERRAERWRERHAYPAYVPPPVYAPPPVVYAPPPSPGISLFFPLHIR